MQRGIAKILSGLFFCAVILGLSLTASAQFRAAVQGTVTDSGGGIITGATVNLTNNETGRVQTATTSDNGFYRFSGLAPGSYKVSVENQNFKKKDLDNIQVAAEITQSVDVVLEAGGISETVTVTGESPALETENANIQKSIGTQEVRNLPQAGRNPYELLRLTPGLFGDSARSGTGQAVNLPNSPGPGGSNSSIFQSENQVPVSASGQRVTSNNFQVDGVSVNSLQYGGAAVLTPNQESVKEVVVSSSSYSAEDGRNSGAQIKVVSQNGTNQFHGSAFFKYNSPKFNAFNKFFGNSLRPAAPSRVENRDKQYGASFGGPVILPRFGEGGPAIYSGKDKLFFFFSYEGLRNNTSNTYQEFVETAQYRQQVINARPGGVTARIFQTPGIEPRIVSVIPRTCASLFGGAAAARCRDVVGGLDLGSVTGVRNTYLPLGGGVGNADIGGGFDGIPDIQFATLENPQQQRGNQYNLRFDYNLNSRNQIALSTYLTRRSDLSANVASRSRASSDIRDKPLTYIITGIVISNLSSTLVNEFRTNFTRFSSDQVKASEETNFGIPRVEVEGLPFDRIRFGAERSETTPAIFGQNTLEFRDSLTQVFGNHVLKYGGEYRREFDNNDLSGGARPVYSFVGLFNLANDTPIFEGVNVDPRTGAPANSQRLFRTSNFAGFVQDDWKVRPNLTLNLGLRYEFFSPLTEKENRLTNLALGSGDRTLTDAKVAFVDKISKADYNNFAPRVGFAYSPNFLGENKMVLRGGFGLYYNRVENVVFSNSRGNPPSFGRFNICCGTAATDFGTPFVGGQILYGTGSSTAATSFPTNPVLGGGINPATGLPIGGAVEFYGSQASVPNAEVYKYSIEMQYELPYRITASVGYEGNQSRKLVRIANQNYLYRPNTKLFAVYFPTADVTAGYNGLNVRAERRFAQGFQIAANYRFSKSVDTLSNEGPGGDTNQTYPVDQGLEKGPSDYDVRHNLVISGLYELPFFRNRKTIAGKILGGFEISGILSRHSGFPWTPKIAPNNAPQDCLRSIADDPFTQLCVVRPVRFFGGVNQDTSNDSFLRPNGYFTGGGSRYFQTTLNDPNGNPNDDIRPTFQGNVPGIGRNSFRGPNYFAVDMSIAKRFGLPNFGHYNEGPSLELKVNFFNLFNNLNLAQFNYSSSGVFVNNANFGEPGGAYAGRTVEFQARFRF
jgi:hypothetical protein